MATVYNLLDTAGITVTVHQIIAFHGIAPRDRPRKLSTANPRNTPLHFGDENMLDKLEQIVNTGSNAAHAGPA
jgi:hypothetical protein